jgi:D-glycero-D-manno-heptose 1,7-bisphosphate phosphatase
MRRAVFLDRDGVVNVSPGPGYVTRWEDFRLEPGIVGVLRVIRARGYESVVVTNQRGVALGLVQTQELDRIHRELRSRLLNDYGLSLLDVLHCPHDDTDACACRKPKPGMLLEAARRHRLDLATSWMVGDGERDVAAGRAAGCRTIRVCPPGTATAADERAENVGALVRLLERVLEPAAP